MAVLRVPADYPSVAAASAAAAAGDTISVAATYAGNEAATVSVNNLTILAPASVPGLSITLGAGVVTLKLGGAANINVTGNSLANVIYGNAGNNVLDGGSGRDHFISSAGNDTYIGGGGVDRDVVDYSHDAAKGAKTGIVVNQSEKHTQGGAAPDSVLDGFGGTDSIPGIRDIIATNFADRIYGGGHSNTLSGLGGNDYIYGGDGGDIISGGAGADVLDGGTGSDKLSGGAGSDRFVYAATGFGHDTITDFQSKGVGHDFLQISKSLAQDYQALVDGGHLGSSGGDAALIFGGSEAVLTGVKAGTLTASDFKFV